jgi:signal transduction histidine kinase
MSSFARNLILALVLLLVFLAVAVTGLAWLQGETRRLQADAIASKQAQFVKAIEVTHRDPQTWDEKYQQDLGALLGGTVTLESEVAQPVARGARATGGLSFEYAFPDSGGLHARVLFAAPATSKLVAVHERMLMALVLFALLMLAICVLLPFFYRPGFESASGAPLANVRSEMYELEHFARVSVERSEALKRETGARHRAEEDLQVSRTLLDRSIQERLQLGRELHDNICQTLYAVSLSLEGVKRTISDAGTGTAGPRLDQCIAELRRLNHEVRSYLKDLEPDTILRQPFTEAVESMLAAQSQSDGPKLVQDLQSDATDLITPGQTTEVVNVLREAISNSMRHGHARTLTLQARRGEESVLFAVQDDGIGFDGAAAASHGHGLANMEARAAALGGSVKLTSAPGKGTRVLLTVPIIPEVRT